MKFTEIIELSLLYEKLKNAKKRGYLKAYNKHLQAIKDLVITDKEGEYNRKQILKISEPQFKTIHLGDVTFTAMRYHPFETESDVVVEIDGLPKFSIPSAKTKKGA